MGNRNINKIRNCCTRKRKRKVKRHAGMFGYQNKQSDNIPITLTEFVPVQPTHAQNEISSLETASYEEIQHVNIITDEFENKMTCALETTKFDDEDLIIAAEKENEDYQPEPVGLSPITVKEEPLYTEGTESLDGFILSDASDVEDTPSCSNMIFSNKRPCRVEHQTSAKAPVISCPLCGHVFKAAVTESQVSAEVQSLKQALREKCYLLNNVRDEVSGLKEKNKKLDEELLFYRNHFKSLPQPIKIESLKTHDE